MWDIVGHGQAIERLRHGLQSGRVSHAYLITGPARVGKTTLALRLAQALNCTEAEAPCLRCRSCQQIERGVHLDVRILQLEGAGGEVDEGEERGRTRAGEKSIGIGQVRALQREVALAPHAGRYKVYLIVNAENLSIDASNSLLKVLEEPPPQVVLILTATDDNMLLPTVASRCQPIRLQPVAAAAVAEHLRQRHGVAAERAELLARLSGGRVGWAIAAAEDEEVLAERAEVLERLTSLVEAGPAKRMAVAGRMATDFARERGSVNLALELWLTWWRDVLLVQAGAEDLVTNYDRLEALRGQAGRCTAAHSRAYLAHMEATRVQLDQNVNPRLALESLLLDIPEMRGS